MARLLLILSLVGCDDAEPFRYQGEPGQATEVLFAGWTPLVQASIDQGPAHLMLVDTGAPYSYVDRMVFDVERGDLAAFGLGFPDHEFREIDFDGALGGLIGADIVSQFQFVVDYQGYRAFLFDGVELPAEIGADVLAAEPVSAPVLGTRRMVVDAEIEGVSVAVLLDTGASYVTVDAALLDELGGGDRPELCCQDIVTAEGRLSVPLTRLKEVSLGATAAVTSVPAMAEPEESDLLAGLSADARRPIRALLGGAYLREFLTTIDFPGERLWLERYRADDHIDRREFIGPGFEVGERLGNYSVTQVYQGTEAEQAGVTRAYGLDAVNGTFVSGRDSLAVEELLHGFDPGDVVHFQFGVGGDIVELDLTIVDLLPEYR